MESKRKDTVWSIAGLLLLAGIFSFSLFEGYNLKHAESEQLVKVTLKERIDNATEVRIAGSFNNWQARCCLEKIEGSDEWSIVLQLAPGMYEYILLVDGENWVPDKSSAKVKDGLGGRNGVLHVNRTVVKQGGGNV